MGRLWSRPSGRRYWSGNWSESGEGYIAAPRTGLSKQAETSIVAYPQGWATVRSEVEKRLYGALKRVLNWGGFTRRYNSGDLANHLLTRKLNDHSKSKGSWTCQSLSGRRLASSLIGLGGHLLSGLERRSKVALAGETILGGLYFGPQKGLKQLERLI